eukprot:RCo052544
MASCDSAGTEALPGVPVERENGQFPTDYMPVTSQDPVVALDARAFHVVSMGPVPPPHLVEMPLSDPGPACDSGGSSSGKAPRYPEIGESVGAVVEPRGWWMEYVMKFKGRPGAARPPSELWGCFVCCEVVCVKTLFRDEQVRF